MHVCLCVCVRRCGCVHVCLIYFNRCLNICLLFKIFIFPVFLHQAFPVSTGHYTWRCSKLFVRQNSTNTERWMIPNSHLNKLGYFYLSVWNLYSSQEHNLSVCLALGDWVREYKKRATQMYSKKIEDRREKKHRAEQIVKEQGRQRGKLERRKIWLKQRERVLQRIHRFTSCFIAYLVKKEIYVDVLQIFCPSLYRLYSLLWWQINCWLVECWLGWFSSP